jgi:hypothetical protein
MVCAYICECLPLYCFKSKKRIISGILQYVLFYSSVKHARARTLLAERASDRTSIGPAPFRTSPTSPRHRPCRQPLSHVNLMCNTRSTFETSRCNSCNIQKRQMKYLKQAFETLAKTSKKIFENHCKHMQHPNKIRSTCKHTYETHENS